MNEPTPIEPERPAVSGAAHGSAFDAIADAMEYGRLTEADWQKIYEATRERLIATEFDGEDSRSNRVICEGIVSNALFDIRDWRNRPNAKLTDAP
jgi:predicted nucleotidyltransferase